MWVMKMVNFVKHNTLRDFVIIEGYDVDDVRRRVIETQHTLFSEGKDVTNIDINVIPDRVDEIEEVIDIGIVGREHKFKYKIVAVIVFEEVVKVELEIAGDVDED